ncbi:MAG TPA: hypothetical protein DG761_05175 [Gammaproteobacteria bacterium]|jgi:transcriptional regulator with XRE-family HTH domain|nr:hypothetical protein [Acidiferrobacteraceae bacterium]MDP6919134.1 helix-turn-helix transcriptional regulator [Arenicellales bacterium]HCX87394.1 hypothetical protein [Gammaproteobacteria bacterium]|tara:strand:+ start:1603 stop:1806 length:204 start_codon:yes stop_codon:yes gene_type:complete
MQDLRKTRDFTLTKLSQLTALSQGYLSQIALEYQIPRLKTLHSIRRTLGVTISWFFSPASTGDAEML